MIEHRPYESLGQFRNDWLQARYHFSFSGYRDPARMGWGALRVWNDDRISAQTGFAPHSHQDMEIITYVRTGAITHEDSLGNRGRTAAGDVQVMTAGAGVTHSEFNLEDEDTTLFQIWITPRARGGAPGYGAAKFPPAEAGGRLVTLASGFADEIAAGALPIGQDARVLAATLPAGATLRHALPAGMCGYLVMDQGTANIGGVHFKPGDGAAIPNAEEIVIETQDTAKFVLVEVPQD